MLETFVPYGHEVNKHHAHEHVINQIAELYFWTEESFGDSLRWRIEREPDGRGCEQQGW